MTLADMVRECHGWGLVNIFCDHEQVVRGEAEAFASFGRDVNEGGGDIFVAMEPAEEGRKNNISFRVD